MAQRWFGRRRFILFRGIFFVNTARRHANKTPVRATLTAAVLLAMAAPAAFAQDCADRRSPARPSAPAPPRPARSPPPSATWPPPAATTAPPSATTPTAIGSNVHRRRQPAAQRDRRQRHGRRQPAPAPRGTQQLGLRQPAPMPAATTPPPSAATPRPPSAAATAASAHGAKAYARPMPRRSAPARTPAAPTPPPSARSTKPPVPRHRPRRPRQSRRRHRGHRRRPSRPKAPDIYTRLPGCDGQRLGHVQHRLGCVSRATGNFGVAVGPHSPSDGRVLHRAG